MIAAATPIATLVEDSLFLLDHARIVGKAIPPDVILPILQTRDSVAAGTLSAADETAFRVAFAELVAFMQPVTLESLSPESEAAADKERASYFRKMTWLLAFTIPFSALSFGVSYLTKDITAMLDAECRLEAALSCSPTPAAARSRDEHDTPVIDAAALKRTNQLLFFRVSWLNFMTLYSVHEERTDYLYGAHPVKVFQDLYTVGYDLLNRKQLIYGAISSYLLPVMYASLGAVAYGLRNLSDQTMARTVLPGTFLRARMRLRLAILAGVMIGFFEDFGTANLSPLATAFLVGYAVEIFFSFLDSTIQAFRNAMPGSAPSGGTLLR